MTLRSPARLLTCLAVIAAVLPLGVASGSGSTVASAPVAATEPTPTPTTSREVTLITGDVVRVDRIGGRTAVSISRAASGSAAYESYTLRGDTYVVPSSALPYVRSGALDRDLFNVTGLLAQGYGDGATGRLPVIVTYGDDTGTSVLRARSEALPASARSHTLPSVDGAAVSVAKS